MWKLDNGNEGSHTSTSMHTNISMQQASMEKYIFSMVKITMGNVQNTAFLDNKCHGNTKVPK